MNSQQVNWHGLLLASWIYYSLLLTHCHDYKMHNHFPLTWKFFNFTLTFWNLSHNTLYVHLFIFVFLFLCDSEVWTSFSFFIYEKNLSCTVSLSPYYIFETPIYSVWEHLILVSWSFNLSLLSISISSVLYSG